MTVADSHRPDPVTPSATPRVPRPRLTLHRPTRHPDQPPPVGGSCAGVPLPCRASLRRRAALAAYLAEPESRRTREVLFRTLDGIDRGVARGAAPLDRAGLRLLR
ncbi:hypothetical protein J421_1912 [Gemmatirosa kalamazoonensis]|uniref:Uncharacterized protein n=1 Tax=Gemmatirosa kalamazoonensis TaxID=861299 RepID=W0REB7_9BACT|nr:hypothetical protein [Gemmatirosa kalamazoonensis]AHG89449.1 hypothetical protein J421_1912 [Gemmatirosa kalamazoonensis]